MICLLTCDTHDVTWLLYPWMYSHLLILAVNQLHVSINVHDFFSAINWKGRRVLHIVSTRSLSL